MRTDSRDGLIQAAGAAPAPFRCGGAEFATDHSRADICLSHLVAIFESAVATAVATSAGRFLLDRQLAARLPEQLSRRIRFGGSFRLIHTLVIQFPLG